MVVVAVGLLGSPAACAQGTIHFTTKVGAALDAPIRDARGQLAGGTGTNTVMVQLYAGRPGTALKPIGQPLPLRSDQGIGYVTGGGSVSVPGLPPGTPAQAKVVAWKATLGKTFTEAVAKGRGGVGESKVVTLKALGGDKIPPAMLKGLSGFSLAPPSLKSK